MTLRDCPYCGRKCYGATCRTCQPLAAAERAEREGDFNAEIAALEALTCDCHACDWVEGDNGAIRCERCGGYAGVPGTSICIVAVADA